MGGLAGWIGAAPQTDASSPVERMLAAQRHRGAFRASTRVELGGHGIDLACLQRTARSRESPDRLAERAGYALALDGSVSNSVELRRALRSEGVDVPEAAEAELLLHALIRWGGAALARIHGAWALAFVDPHLQQVWLARDHLGCKPLYFCARAEGFFFASEIKGILQGTGDRFGADARVVSRFLDQTLLDAQPETFFSGIQAVPAGHVMVLECARRPPWRPEPTPFWRIPERDGFAGSEAERVAAVRERVLEAVRRQLQGEGRIALLVSGGVDSSAVAAAACAAPEGRDLLLLSGVNPDGPEPMLDSLCRHLDRETHRASMAIPAQRALGDLETVIGFHDEPVRSFAVVATYRLKEAARELGVSVLLGGFGSDELFAGRLVHMVFYVQSLIRSGRLFEAARVAAAIARRRTIRPRFRVAVQKRYFPSLDRMRIDVAGQALGAPRRHDDLGLGPGSCHERLIDEITRLSLPSLLHYDDRTSMAFGLENRYALLDLPLVDLVAPMAPSWKLRDGFPKWLLRMAMDPYLPREICWQKVTQSRRDVYGDWMKRDLHPHIQSLLAGDLASVELGLLDRDALRRHYAAFCEQPSNAGAISAHDVFNWLAIELWARRFEPHLRSQ